MVIFLLLITDTQENASHIAQAVTVEYESLGRPLVTTEDAIRANSYVDNIKPSVINVGDAKGEEKLVPQLLLLWLNGQYTIPGPPWSSLIIYGNGSKSLI